MSLLSLSKQTKLVKTDDFSSVFNFRKRIAGKYLVFHYKLEAAQVVENHISSEYALSIRVGLAVAKKVAKRAVDRNYMKRVLREFVRMQLKQSAAIQPKLMKVDVVIRVQKIYSDQQFIEVNKEFNQLFNGLLQKLH